MLPAVPDPHRRPAKRPATSLTSLVASTSASAAALGAAVGLLEHSAILGVLFAVVGAGVRLGIAAFQGIRSLPVEQLDPFALPEPWRGLVQRAVDAGRRFHQAVDAWPAGPLRDRLMTLGDAVDSEVSGVWIAARQGAAISPGYPVGPKAPSKEDLSRELEAVQLEKSELPAGDSTRREDLDRAEQALAAQIRAAERAKRTSRAVAERLQVLVARLDEAVASVVALTAAPGGAEDVEGAMGTIDALGQEIAALQAALGEAAQLPGASAPQPEPPSAPTAS